jgi:uncharacterized protein (DUF1015 family)
MSPIFSLHEGDAWKHIEGYVRDEPWAEVTDDEGTVHRIWRIGEPDVHRAVAAELADSELLIADGHHRYETARTYADEIGGDGPHRYTLMALVSLEDPGLTVFGYHRLLTNLGESGPQQALREALLANFDVEEVPVEQLDPAGEEGVGVFGYIDAHHRKGFRLRLKDTSVLEAAMPDASPAFRELDAAILESLLLRDALGMSAEDIEAKRGIAYTASAEKALASLDEGTLAAFLLRPTPVQQVRDVAAAGATMPPKSTYFFPKLLTGIVFNPLS